MTPSDSFSVFLCFSLSSSSSNTLLSKCTPGLSSSLVLWNFSLSFLGLGDLFKGEPESKLAGVSWRLLCREECVSDVGRCKESGEAFSFSEIALMVVFGVPPSLCSVLLCSLLDILKG